MEVEQVIRARDTLKKIKYTAKKINRKTGETYEQELSVPLIVKLDNEVHIYEENMIVLWDDANALLYYYCYNSQANKPDMVGRNKIVMPAMLRCSGYGEIQEIMACLNEDTLLKSLDIIKPDVKFYVTDAAESINDEKKKIIHAMFCLNTQAQTDYDHTAKPYNK